MHYPLVRLFYGLLKSLQSFSVRTKSLVASKALMVINLIAAYVKMLYYDKTDVSEGIDVNKTNESKQCIICHYWYFLNRL